MIYVVENDETSASEFANSLSISNNFIKNKMEKNILQSATKYFTSDHYKIKLDCFSNFFDRLQIFTGIEIDMINKRITGF